MARLGHNTRRLITTTTRNTFRAVALVCVLASQWQVPLPWLHCHGAPCDPAMAQRLDQHTSVFHADGETSGIEWHLHFAVLDDIVRNGGCPVPRGETDEEDQSRRTVERFAPVSYDAGHGASRYREGLANVVRQDATVNTPDVLSGRSERRQFLGDHTALGRLQVVLCVALC